MSCAVLLVAVGIVIRTQIVGYFPAGVERIWGIIWSDPGAILCYPPLIVYLDSHVFSVLLFEFPGIRNLFSTVLYDGVRPQCKICYDKRDE